MFADIITVTSLLVDDIDLETATVTMHSEHHGVASIIVRKPFPYIL